MSNASTFPRAFHVTFRIWLFAAIVGCTLMIAATAVTAAPARPNVIFIIDDQHASDMLGCYGNKDVKTPNIDRFSGEAVRFNHCISNSPLCTPYRAMLMSGQHPLYSGAFDNDIELLPGRGKYLGEILRDSGYHMGYYGKWHLYGGNRDRGIPPGPYRYGFDNEFLSNNCTLTFDATRAHYWDQEGKTRKLYGDWEPYAQARQAMEFIDRHAHEPFALFVSWHPPHNWPGANDGYNAPAELLALYDPSSLTLRPTATDNATVRRIYQGYMAMITSIDRSFGMLMDKLDEHGLKENTIVVFTADHGDLLRSYDWRINKRRAETGSSRVPLIIRWPTRLKPGVSDLLIGSLDLMPTLLGLLDLKVPETCQGRDASEAIIAGTDDGVDALPLFEIRMNWRGVYTRQYTYSESLHDPTDSDIPGGRKTFDVLYDRRADPWETRNLFDSPEAAGIREQLHQKTHELMRRFGDMGESRDQIFALSLRDEDQGALNLPLGKRKGQWEGRLKGRPIDFLTAARTTPPTRAN